MSILRKDHIVGAGSGGLAGGVAGAAIGAAIAGPPGMAVGAVAGVALGAAAGDQVAEARDKRDNLGHFEQIHAHMPYYQGGFDWNDYRPAYRFGLDAYARHGGQAFAMVEPRLRDDWDANGRFGSRLAWAQARPAVEHAWRSLDEALHPAPGTT